MSSSYESDYRRLEKLAFNRTTWGAKWFRRYYRLSSSSKSHPDFLVIKKLRSWLLTPIMIWPVNLDVIGHYALDQIVSREGIEQEIELIMRFLADPPAEAIQEMIAQHEREVEEGSYDHLIQATYKYYLKEDELKKNVTLQNEWQEIQKLFPVARFQNQDGFIQRYSIIDQQKFLLWDLNWKNEAHRFQAVFNTFCYRWHLNGMDRNEPVLLKTCINLTPLGTYIFIPAYWSLDPHRDIKWNAVSSLHKVRCIGKQGPKLYKDRAERREVGQRIKKLLVEAKEKGFRGEDRDYWIMGQMGWNINTDPVQIRRFVKYAETHP